MAWLDDRDGVCRLFLFNQAPFPLQLFNQNFYFLFLSICKQIEDSKGLFNSQASEVLPL